MYFDYTDYISINDDFFVRELTKSYPWDFTQEIGFLFKITIEYLNEKGCIEDFYIKNESIVHKTAIVEKNVTIKNFTFIGKGCFIAAGSYLRNGVILSEKCIIGPGVEIKSSLLLPETRVAHFNFVGDSILGTDVNLEAGSIIANYRNELPKENTIQIYVDGKIIDTKNNKFGALIGENTRVGANSVIAPGALIRRGAIIERLTLVDNWRDANRLRTEN